MPSTNCLEPQGRLAGSNAKHFYVWLEMSSFVQWFSPERKEQVRRQPRPVPTPANLQRLWMCSCSILWADREYRRTTAMHTCGQSFGIHVGTWASDHLVTPCCLISGRAFAQGKVCNHPELLEPRGAVTLQQAGSACDCLWVEGREI